MNEIWKDIEGYEGIYQVSSLGRVRSLDRIVMVYRQGQHIRKIPGKMKKPHLSNIGYYSVNLSKDNRPKFMLVHRLVAAAFIPNPYNLPEVNHKDENKLNNMVENLEWCDSKYNINYGTSIQRKNEATSIKVLQRDLNGKLIAEYTNSLEASKITGVERSTIARCCRKERITAGGFIWEYKSNH